MIYEIYNKNNDLIKIFENEIKAQKYMNSFKGYEMIKINRKIEEELDEIIIDYNMSESYNCSQITLDFLKDKIKIYKNYIKKTK